VNSNLSVTLMVRYTGEYSQPARPVRALGARGGAAGNSAYWTVVQNGDVHPPQFAEVDGVFTPGGTYTVTVLVNGNTYQAFIDPDGVYDANSVLITTLINSTFSSGHVGLYDFYPELSFSNFSVSDVTAVPLSASPPLTALGIGALSLLGWCRKRKAAAEAAV
jgi:hypothetical protein